MAISSFPWPNQLLVVFRNWVFWNFSGYFFHITNSPCVFLVCLCFFFGFVILLKPFFNGNFQFSLGLQFSLAKSITCSIQK